MNIVHITWGFNPGGIETMLIDIANEQIKSEDVTIIVVNDMVNQTMVECLNSKVKIYCCGRKQGSKNPLPILRMNYYLYISRPNVIHYHGDGLTKYTFFKAVKVLTIHNVHSVCSEYGKYDKLFAISKAVKDYVNEKGFQSIVIENGIRVNGIIQRKKWTIDNGCRIVQVGRLYHQHKGQNLMIEAMNVLVNLKKYKNVHVDFIGDGSSYELLKKMVDDHCLNDFVSFLGSRDRNYIYSHLKDYDLCIQPSISEGFGLTVAEAMAAKVPVIVSDVPGTMEVIDNGQYGLFFESGNAEDLACKIERFLLEDGMDAGKIEVAWNYVYNNFDISNTVKKYLEEYKKLLSSETMH